MSAPPWDPALRADVAILIALPEEFQQLADEYANTWHAQENPNQRGSDFLFLGPGGYRCVAAIMPRMGPTVAGLVSARLLAWRPAVIINVGIAGGFKNDLCIGDVIVPRQVDAYDETGKMQEQRWERRGSAYRPSAGLLACVQELKFSDREAFAEWVNDGVAQFTELRTGPDAKRVEALLKRKRRVLRESPGVSTNHLASGSFVVASKEFAEWIRKSNADIHAGEMEAAGMLAAAEYQRESVETLVVRGISDHVDADKRKLDAIGNGALRRLAMANAWRLVCALMRLGKLPRSPVDVGATSKAKVSPTRLPTGAKQLFGRETELAWLDQAWEQGANVATIVAWGGVGKTALVHEWVTRLLARRLAIEYVFDWSFYSQGVRERGAVSAANFVREALRFFGEPALADSSASPWDKGARLAEVVGATRSLLILDGLEPLQEPKFGALKEGSVEALLKGLAAQNAGLCVVTTRVAVRELERFERSTSPRLPLDHLSAEAGADVLRSSFEEGGGPKAVVSTQAEREEISVAVRGHALTLNLLGGYIRRALGDVRRWKEIDFARADEEHGGHAFRVMDAYVRWFAEAGTVGQRQLAVLRLLGLFDRPADPGCLEALREGKAIEGLTEVLVDLDERGWRLLVSSLQDMRLVTCGEYEPVSVRGYDEETANLAGRYGAVPGETKLRRSREFGSDALVLDAHPLVREYFEQELQRTNLSAWREAHRRLYFYLCESVPYWPEGIEGLQPLYQAVAHGCASGRIQEVCAVIYRSRILRGARVYSVKQLGAISDDLVAVACFFERTWDGPSTDLSETDRSWVLGEAAFRLRILGRPSEAIQPLQKGLQMEIDRGDWRNAAVGAGNLSEVELALGRTGAAVEAAVQSVVYADRSEDNPRRIWMRSILADARHQSGDFAEASQLFEQAEAIQAQWQPEFPWLYSVQGYRYADLLLRSPERASWQTWLGAATHASELLTLCAEVHDRATQTLSWASLAGWILDIALDHLTLGRTTMCAATLGTSTPAGTTTKPTQLFAIAREHLDAAVDGLRKSGNLDDLPLGLIARAHLHGVDHRPDLARIDLDDAWTLAERGPMPLYQADIQLTRARLFRDRDALAQARILITRHEYNRRLPELTDAELAAKSWPS